MIASLLTRLRAWREASLANSITYSAALIAILASGIVAGLSFGVILWTSSQAHLAEQRDIAQRAADRIDRAARVVVEISAELAKSAMFVNAVLDSRGRDVYLSPFVQNFRFPIGTETGVALCDINGAKLAGNRSALSTCGENSEEFKRALNTPQAIVVVINPTGGQSTFRVYQGVISPYGSSIEGVLVTQAALDGFLRDLPAELGVRRVVIRAPALNRIVATAGVSSSNFELTHSGVPVLVKLGQPGAPSLLLGIEEDDTAAPNTLRRLAIAYVLGVAVLVAIVARRTRRAAMKLARPLTALAARSRQLAATRESYTGIEVPPQSSREVIDLAESMQTMVDAVHANENSLEKIVAERTRSLRDAEASLRSVFDAAIDVAIIAVSRDETISLFNKGAETILGFAQTELLGVAGLERLQADQFLQERRLAAGTPNHTEQVSITALLLQEQARSAGSAFDWQLQCKDGSVRDVFLSIRPLLSGTGESIGYVMIASDITEKKSSEARRVELEEQLRQSQKMEAIGTLAGGIAHDFNNLVASILGNAELAAEDMQGHPEASVSLNEIRKAAVRGRDLVQQIMSFSRRRPTIKLAINVADTIGESARLLRSTLSSVVSLQFVSHLREPRFIMADSTQISQIIMNLGTNAYQAMQGRPGLITIELYDEELHATSQGLPAGRYVKILFRDDGSGIAPAVITRMFEPFFTTKPIGEGTGLGLAVIHGIVANHGGNIEVESEVGRGTTFTLMLPVVDAPTEPEIASSDVVAAPGVGQRILYLDDDEALVFLVQRLLQRRGFTVSGFSDQQAALDALRRTPAGFDLLITDYNMPGATGIDVAREARRMCPTLKIIIASGLVTEALQAAADALAVDAVLFKATNIEDYCEAINKVISQGTGG